MFPVQVRHAVLITYFVCLQGLMRYAYDLDKDKEYQAGTVYVNGRSHTEHNLYDYANVSEYFCGRSCDQNSCPVVLMLFFLIFTVIASVV